ncbi:MAG: response regulator [Chthoniobacteraceae bacterium]
MSEPPVTVLLVEDNQEHIDLLQQLFASTPEMMEFKLVTAGTLGRALHRLREGGIGLTLLDLGLPDSDGIETFIRVLEAAPDLPIVVLSGINDVALAIETVQLGAQDYLVKGHVDNHLLIRSVQYALERKRVQLQLSRANEDLELRVQERTAALQQINARLQREITERRRAEEETVESNRQLAAALGQIRATQEQVIARERMHALGRMANGIAHDFNNTLSPILGFSELLLMKPDMSADPARLRTYLEAICNGAKDAARVVSRLREFHRRRDEGDVFTPVLINDLVEQVVSFTQPRWKDQALAAGVNIDFKLELGQVPSVAGNEDELREALVHLVFNAIEAITARGRITIRTEVQGRWLVVTVADNGTGMSEEVRARCVEPFFTTKGDQSGGLGLGSVYGIITRHDGEMDIQSDSGRGTSVSISLPLERADKAPKASKPPAQPTQPLRILIVDDEPLVREVISVYLSEDQHVLAEATNGREGLELFRKGKFDIVVTDRAMPELNGDQLASEIKKLKPSQPVILLTGFGDLMNEAGENPTGVDLVVAKPFTLNTLRDAIQTVLRTP